MFRKLLVGVIALALPLAAAASGIVQSARGTVEAGGAALKQGARLFPGTFVSTGAQSQVVLRFDDGMQIVLHENSYLRILDFRYTPTGSSNDRAVFELLRGAARVVTGKIAAQNPSQFFFRAPQVELQADQPSDFTVALVNPAYITVNAGRLSAHNGYGTSQLGSGSVTSIASRSAAPVAISSSALPPSAAAATTNLAAASVAPVAGGVSSGAGVAGTAGVGFGVPAVAAGAAAIGLGMAAARSNSRSPVSHAPNH